MVEGHGTPARVEVLRERLRRCVAFLSAARRRHEVVDVVAEAASDEEATDAVSELLEVDTDSASEIIELPVKAFSKERTTRLEDEADRLERRVATLADRASQRDEADPQS